jgi:hypothetical protein
MVAGERRSSRARRSETIGSIGEAVYIGRGKRGT